MSRRARPSARASASPDRAAGTDEAPSNAALLDQLDTEARGPFDTPLLNAALSEAFGTELGGLSAAWSTDEENDAIGADASTTGRAMSFGSSVDEDLQDPDSMAIIAEETAHALAGGGSGQTRLDGPGDPGESRAQEAGDRFARWVEGGMEGRAPALSPAAGGRAETHRHANTTLSGTPPLRRGSRGSRVSLLQELLVDHGHPVAVDGDFGPKTDAAVRSFQASSGLAVDGIVGPETAAALNSSHSTAPSTGGGSLTGRPPLQRGSSGAQVRTAQERLNAHGASLSVDGDFGPRTESAVRSFQGSHGLVADGVIGPSTASELNQAPSTAPGPSTQPGPLPSGNVTAHFTWAEFGCRDGTPVPEAYRPNVQTLCEQLEVLRSAAGGRSIRVNSGYRTPTYNAQIGGVSNSQHLYAKASDISVSGMSPGRVADLIEDLIRQGRMRQGGLGRYSTFTHYDVRGTAARW